MLKKLLAVKKLTTTEELVKTWTHELLVNPSSVPWKDYVAFTEKGLAHFEDNSSPDFLVGKLLLAATALHLDPDVPKAERLAIWKAMTELIFRAAEAADLLGLIVSDTYRPKPNAQG